MSHGYPSFDLDPFCDELLDEPYTYYRQLRDAGRLFRLTRYDVLGLARVRRNPADHLAFGNGIHMCVGAPLARLEIDSIVRAMSEKVRHIKLAGDPERQLNSTSRGFVNLPVVIELP